MRKKVPTKEYIAKGILNFFQKRKKEVDLIRKSKDFFINCVTSKHMDSGEYKKDNEHLNKYIDKITPYQRKQICDEQDEIKQIELLARFAEEYGKEIDIYSRDVQEFHNSFAEFCYQTIDTYNSEYFISWFEQRINNHSVVIPSSSEINQIIDDFLTWIPQSIVDCYLIIPLPFAEIKKSVSLGSGSFIINPYPDNTTWLRHATKKSTDIIGREIEKCLNFQKNDIHITKELADFEKYYSKDILTHPLLIVTHRNLFENVCEYAVRYSLYAKMCIKIVLSVSNANTTIGGRSINYQESEHIFICSKKHTLTSRYLSSPQNYFCYTLDLLHEQENKGYLINLLSLWDNTMPLACLLRRAIMNFCWDADPRARTFEHNSIKILMLFTGIEILLLNFSKRGEKKNKIAQIMSNLYDGHIYEKNQIEQAVINLYNARSLYIHEGKNSSHKYIAHFNEYGNFVTDDDSLKIVEDVFFNILINFPTKENDLLHRATGLEEWQDKCKAILGEKNSYLKRGLDCVINRIKNIQLKLCKR